MNTKCAVREIILDLPLSPGREPPKERQDYGHHASPQTDPTHGGVPETGTLTVSIRILPQHHHKLKKSSGPGMCCPLPANTGVGERSEAEGKVRDIHL